MLKLLSILSTIIIVSFYYFPVSFMAFPEINTKLILGVIGLTCFGINISRNKKSKIPHDYIRLILYSVIFSLICYISVILNGTNDNAYTRYFVSMSVWLFAAYAVCELIKAIHSHISLPILIHYLLAVALIQCALSLIIEYYAPFRVIVDSIFFQDQEFLHEVKRIYGIGASLDTAGIRFSLVLILTAYLMTICNNSELKKYQIIYIIGFIVITVVGNMIARTTIVGTGLGIAYLVYAQLKNNDYKPFNTKTLTWISLALTISIAICIYLYNNNADFHKQIRFAFEGFFSIAEEGEWDVSSNNRLKTMIVFPENLKTWIIGDGYFSNPIETDPYFVGEYIGGYYMGTDIGYLRFIFYCGVVGLLAFSYFLCCCANICIHRFPKEKIMIIFLLLAHFIVWLKVSTDVFLIFALLMMMDIDEDNRPTEEILLEK